METSGKLCGAHACARSTGPTFSAFIASFQHMTVGTRQTARVFTRVGMFAHNGHIPTYFKADPEGDDCVPPDDAAAMCGS